MMRAIVINEKNSERLAEAIREGESRVRVRLGSVESLKEEVENVDNYFRKDLGLARKDFAGIRASVNLHYAQVANSYNGIPESTWATVEATKTGWKLLSVWRRESYKWGDWYTVDDETKERVDAAIVNKIRHHKF